MLHGSYLQGMETAKRAGRWLGALVCTDPTYKEWKRVHPRFNFLNANLSTDPTYKEWKQRVVN